jgi:hypothetical protein
VPFRCASIVNFLAGLQAAPHSTTAGYVWCARFRLTGEAIATLQRDATGLKEKIVNHIQSIPLSRRHIGWRVRPHRSDDGTAVLLLRYGFNLAGENVELEFLRALSPTVVALFVAFLSLPGVLKVWAEFKNIRPASHRAESDFAWNTAERYEDVALRRYAEQLSYSTIVPDIDLDHSQRKLLLSLPESRKAISLFLRCRNFVVVIAHQRNIKWRKSRHSNSIYRRWIKAMCLAGYFAFGAAAILPFIGRQFVPLALEILTETYGLFATAFLLIAALNVLIYRFRMEFAEELLTLATNFLEDETTE